MSSPFPRPTTITPLPVADLVATLGAELHAAPAEDGEPPAAAGHDAPEAAVRGVTLDSRTVQPGDLYAALPGAHVHGARFAAQARDAGAAAVLTDQAGLDLVRAQGVAAPVLVVPDPRAALGRAAAAIYGRPVGAALLTYGITGTNGKTTTAYLVDGGLRRLGRVTGLVGTIETRIGDERIRSTRTTPESSDLQALLAVMAERGVERCTMEVSSHALVMHRVDGVVYDVAAFTNLSQDHLDFHGSMEDYYRAKASLFTPERARRGVVVVDDEWGSRLAREATIPVVTVSATGRPADWQVTDLGERRFALTGPGARLDLTCPLPGDFNQVNTAVAALILHLGGEDLAQAAEAVCGDPQVPGRMEQVPGPAGAPVGIVDFAHTPDAITAALQALRSQTRGRLVVVLGAGGDRDAGKRPRMGQAAAAAADVVIVTDDNPRSEDPSAIRAAVLSGVGDQRGHRDQDGHGDRVREVPGRADAIAAAVALARGPQDTVVVLGKGHEQGQEIAGETHPFDDREQLRQALHGRRAERQKQQQKHEPDQRAGAPQVEGEMESDGGGA
ncbi:UDP-N-acetylmuramoyl-L-alanyl-D-glutamate--2,6-diaminopimelate ligase [Arsenicicoccus sp. oral taxon 190]|uniref:UDP-N-acetylmuramoyl-L-alanyl-D-glutamate--2, 6-diaminopimelate ligase n=1 Tax=Arsenicicoccus sp. oral taxon 190 TaxID=1658671 RepID=UPI0009E2512B|nr:UDP-N-acetylmuramoyl-L-alanyl-D-glutamate--2,6-diaminopimelate ligase [Arsenicicoccus sp. oral taxon 190]